MLSVNVTPTQITFISADGTIIATLWRGWGSAPVWRATPTNEQRTQVMSESILYRRADLD